MEHTRNIKVSYLNLKKNAFSYTYCCTIDLTHYVIDNNN